MVQVRRLIIGGVIHRSHFHVQRGGRWRHKMSLKLKCCEFTNKHSPSVHTPLTSSQIQAIIHRAPSGSYSSRKPDSRSVKRTGVSPAACTAVRARHSEPDYSFLSVWREESWLLDCQAVSKNWLSLVFLWRPHHQVVTSSSHNPPHLRYENWEKAFTLVSTEYTVSLDCKLHGQK